MAKVRLTNNVKIAGESIEVADNLNTDNSNMPLSAKQGKVLNEKIKHGTTVPSASLGNDGDIYILHN